MPRDSTLKRRKFLELDSSLRDQRPLGQPCLRVNLIRIEHPGMEGLPYPGEADTKLIPVL